MGEPYCVWCNRSGHAASKACFDAYEAKGATTEDVRKYNAGAIREIENSLMGPVERERLGKAPQWTRLLVNDLIRRIANLRARVHELEKMQNRH